MPSPRTIGFLALLLAVATLTTAAAGGAPFANAGLDQTVEVNRTVYLDGGGSYDADGEIVDYTWHIEAPDGTELTPACESCSSTHFKPTRTGRYNVTLQVEDDDGNVRSDFLYVTVEAQRGPSINLTGPSSAESGDNLTYNATATAGDANLSSLTWQKNGSFARTTILNGGRATDHLSFEYASEVDSVSVTVTDMDGQQATETVDIREKQDSYGPTANWDYRKYGVDMTETDASDFGDKSYDLGDRTVYTDFNGDGEISVDTGGIVEVGANTFQDTRVEMKDENKANVPIEGVDSGKVKDEKPNINNN
jgi:hypothetical protein